LAVLAAIANPVGSEPLNETQRADVLQCISNRENFRARCYLDDRLKHHVIKAVSLVGSKAYKMPDGETTYRKQFIDMIAQNEPDGEFVRLIEYLDSLYTGKVLKYNELWSIIHEDRKHHLANSDFNRALLYLLGHVPDTAISNISGALGMTIPQALYEASLDIIHDSDGSIQAEIERALPREGEGDPSTSQAKLKLETANFPHVAAYFIKANQLHLLERFVREIIHTSEENVAAVLRAFSSGGPDALIPVIVEITGRHVVAEQLTRESGARGPLPPPAASISTDDE
jgi:hypothetical protein